MTLEETARILCEPDARYSEFERAILLFGLQVATLSPTRPCLESYARILAAMKILEHIENAQGLPHRSSLTERLAVPEYQKILNQMLVREGGWSNIARKWTPRKLSIEIKSRWNDARDADRLVEFSYRFDKFAKVDQRKAGVTMARHFVCKTSKLSDGTLKARWREYGKTAALGYLLWKIEVRPANVKKKKFVERLLTQAADIERLRRLFAAYRDVSKVLRRRGYDCEPVVVKCVSKIRPQLEVQEFSSDELNIIKDYKS